MYGSTTKGDVVKRSDCILVYGSTTKGGVVKGSDCILVYESTTKGDVVQRSDCILVYGNTTKGGVVQRSDCILVYGSTTKGDVVKRSDCILVYGSTTKCDVVKRSDCILVYGSTTKGDFVKRSHTTEVPTHLRMLLQSQPFVPHCYRKPQGIPHTRRPVSQCFIPSVDIQIHKLLCHYMSGLSLHNLPPLLCPINCNWYKRLTTKLVLEHRTCSGT